MERVINLPLRAGQRITDRSISTQKIMDDLIAKILASGMSGPLRNEKIHFRVSKENIQQLTIIAHELEISVHELLRIGLEQSRLVSTH